LNDLVFFLTLAGREAVVEVVAHPAGRAASADSNPSRTGDSAIGLVGIDV
jgi:hypothetical protein